jgi:hypothetical protein
MLGWIGVGSVPGLPGAGWSKSGVGGETSGGGASGCTGWLGWNGCSGGGVVAMIIVLLAH